MPYNFLIKFEDFCVLDSLAKRNSEDEILMNLDFRTQRLKEKNPLYKKILLTISFKY